MSVINWSNKKKAQKSISSLLIFTLLSANIAPCLAATKATQAKENLKSAAPLPPSKGMSAKERAARIVPRGYKLTLSAAPTDKEITNLRLFREPLIAMTSKPVTGENQALSNAILAYKAKTNPDDLSDLLKFLQAFPASRWKAALETDLGIRQFETGYLSEALTSWKNAWNKSKSEKGQLQQAIAERAASELVLLEARLGQVDELESHLSEIGSRPMHGSSAARLASAKEGLFALKHSVKDAFKCGPYSLNTILNLDKRTSGLNPILKAASSTINGTNLSQLQGWATDVGLNYQMARKSPGAPIIVPSIMHWKLSHFGAITAQNGEKYRLQDPTFGNAANAWLTPQAINSQGDGYFLVPAGPLPQGWQKISDAEGKKVWGKGYANTRHPGKTPCEKKQPTGPGSGGCCTGLANASVWSMQIDVNIQDTPLSYSPPIGEPMNFHINYNNEEDGQPSIFNMTNISPDWSFNWVSWITFDASNNATVSVRGGGTEQYPYTSPDNVSNPYPPNLVSQAQLVVVGNGIYQRQLPDGSIEVFSLSDGTGVYLLTQIIDPQGNQVSVNWNGSFQVTSITDATGLSTTLNYVSGTNLISQIIDPFGRSATFAYDPTNSFLIAVTDAVGNVSQFGYATASSVINTLTTPYGSTSFITYTPNGATSYPPKGLIVVLPDGTKSVIENWIGETKSTYFWDREATAQYPDDPVNQIYSHCQTTKWLFDQQTAQESPVVSWTKKALEAQITYLTPDEMYGDYQGSSNLPIQVTRVLTGNFAYSATIGGTATSGDTVSLLFVDTGLPNGQTAVPYVVGAADTLDTIASGLATAINGNASLQTIGISAKPSGNVVRLVSASPNSTNYNSSTSSAATETITLLAVENLAETATISGSVTPGDTLTINVVDNSLPSNPLPVTYTAKSGDTLATIASGLASLLAQNSALQTLGFSVYASGNIVTMQSFSNTSTGYFSSTSSGATESITTATGVSQQTWKYQYNASGAVTQAIDPIGRTVNYMYSANNVDLLEVREVTGGDNYLIAKMEYNSQHLPTTMIDGSAESTAYTYNASGQLLTTTDALTNQWTNSYNGITIATIGGTVTSGQAESLTVSDPALPGGAIVLSYTTQAGDTTNSVCSHLAALINANPSLQALRATAAVYGTSALALSSTSPNTTYSKTPSGSVTITLVNSTANYLYSSQGPLAGSADVSTFTWDGNGSPASSADSEGYIQSFLYDGLNRQTAVLFPDGTQTQTVYKNLDAILLVDRLNRTTQNAFDSLDQLAFEIDPLGRKTQYSWCVCGSLSALTDPANNTTTWSHDLEGRVIRKTYADSTSVHFQYESTTSRVHARIDAMNQTTTYNYNADNTRASTTYTNSVNVTPNVIYQYDQHFPRLSTVISGGSAPTYNYSYYPYVTDPFGAASPGGGRISQITNSLVTGAPITFQYDALGRTQNRSINGSANSISWSYDAMSRLTSETNSLGSFNFSYVDQVPSDKGNSRLAQITYPNGQLASFSYYSPKYDERLKQIDNITSGPTPLEISQFTHAYNAAGELTTWGQQQTQHKMNSRQLYDAAGQLTGSQGGAGLPAPPYVTQQYFDYDSASNRCSSQRDNIQSIALGGSVTSGTGTLTVIIQDGALPSGSETVNYAVQTTDTTLHLMAAGLAAAISKDSNLQALGVNAYANGNVVSVRSLSSNITSYTTGVSGGATETLAVGQNTSAENITIGGTITSGDVVKINVYDASLPSSLQTISYTVSSADSAISIAHGLAAAFATLGANSYYSATNNGTAVITVTSNSPNVPRYSNSSGSISETLSMAPVIGGLQTILMGGTITVGDLLKITIVDQGLAGGSEQVNYTVTTSDTSLASLAAHITAAIVNDASLQNIGVTSFSTGPIVTVISSSVNATTIMPAAGNSVSETMTPGAAPNGTSTIVIGGTVSHTVNDKLTVNVYDYALIENGFSSPETVNYSVQAGDASTANVAAGLAAAIAADSKLSSIGVTATSPSNSSVINISSASPRSTTYSVYAPITATETIGVSNATSVLSGYFTNTNSLASLNSGGAVRFAGASDQPLSSCSLSTSAISLSVAQSLYSESLNSGATETITLGQYAGGSQTATIGGVATLNDSLSITITNTAIPGGAATASYVVPTGNPSTAAMASGLAAAVNANSQIQAIGVTASSSGPTLTLASTPTTFSVTNGSTEILTVYPNGSSGGVVSVTGSITAGDVVKITVNNAALSSGATQISYTVLSTDNLQTIASALTAAVNVSGPLLTIGLTAQNSTAAKLNSSTTFTSNPNLAPGNNLVTIAAVNGNNLVSSTNYQIPVVRNATASQTFSYDANGNMTGDGTRTYQYDAENRLIQIGYGGSNLTNLTYDAFGRTVIISESGSISTTKQFIWCEEEQCEERDSSGTLQKQFFTLGQVSGTSKTYFSKNYLGSITELTDSANVIQAEYLYDPYGQVTQPVATQSSDFGFCGYYVHARSGLNLSVHRAYNPTLGRFINRDPSEEHGGVNLYDYVDNDPTDSTDLSGLAPDTFMYQTILVAAMSGFSENHQILFATRKNRTEMGFWVYKKPNHCGNWAYSQPFTSTGLFIDKALAEAHKPSGMIIGAFAHSHPDKRPWWSSARGFENFSVDDIKLLNQDQMTGYLYNAYDQFKSYSPGGDPRGTRAP